MICIGAFVAVGWFVLAKSYTALGYPPVPDWVVNVRLSDDIDAVYEKVKVAFGEGFDLKRHDSEILVMEKAFSEPRALMRFEAQRRRGGSGQCLSVSCLDRRWLNRSYSSWRNR